MGVALQGLAVFGDTQTGGIGHKDACCWSFAVVLRIYTIERQESLDYIGIVGTPR